MSTPPSNAADRDDGLAGPIQKYDALNLVDAAVAIVDARGELVFQNDAFARFNTSVRDSLKNFGAHATLLDCPPIRQAVAAALANGGENPIKRSFFYGRRMQVELSLRVRPLAGNHTGTAAGATITIGEESIAFDNRHLARAQESLQTLAERVRVLSEEKLGNDRLIRILLKEAPFAMVLLNQDRQVLQINRAGERLLGVNEREIVGRACDTLLDCFQSCGHCPVQQGRPKIELDEITGLATGKRRIPLLRSAVIFDDHKGPLILEALVDLTERKQAEQDLRRLSEYNHLLVESTGEGIFSVDREMRCTFVNKAAAAMLGYAPEEMVGRDIPSLIHARQEDGTPLARATLPIAVALATNTSQAGEDMVFWHKNGQAIPVQYLCSPLHEGAEVAGAVVVYRNVAEARAMARKMDYLATHDSLTGLHNRWVFEHRLNQAIETAFQDKVQHVLAYIDLDQFKIVNDTCGHSAGDELLRQIGRLLEAHLRKTDIFARLGGDEFGLLLQNCSREKALEVIENLHALLAAHRFIWNDKSFSLGASIGVVPIDEQMQNAGNALSAADAACYVAKDKGRNRIYVYESDDENLAQRHTEMQWVGRIKEALEENRFSLQYQAIVPVVARHPEGTGIEILVRMLAPDGALIGPASFIPVAERYRLMTDIDRWVVRETLAWLSANHARLPRVKICSINLSGQSINDDKFLGFLLGRLAESKVPQGMICFEITETAAVENLTRAMQFIAAVKQYGCCFALDDFGSGMSSFSYLKHLPVNFLKIDGNFVKNIAHEKIDYAMVEAIHRVGSLMGIKTVAEFVENAEILQRLKDIGVDYAQGYGIGRPRPLAELK